jgi:ubiquinol-cytochrome c reductase cytochrome b subunit
MLGEIALYCFIVLVVTGVFLAMFFNASAAEVTSHGSYRALDGVLMSAAYRSVLDLSFDVRLGLLMRQLHHWAALVFVAAIVMHMFRIFFTGAYRRPRGINWFIGVTLLILAMANGFLGYSVPDDLLSGTGLRTAYSIALPIPFFGDWLAFIIFGGPVPTEVMIPRLYGLHISLLPALTSVAVGLHLAIVWRQLHTNYPGPGRSNQTIAGSRLWPTYAAKAIGLFFLVFGVLAGLSSFVQVNPVWIYGPFKPTDTLAGAQPDWYLGWAEGALRLIPGVNIRTACCLVPSVFFPGVLSSLILFGLLYAVLLVDRRLSGDRDEQHILRRPCEHAFYTALSCAAITFFLVMLFAGSHDVIAVITNGSVVEIRDTFRVLFFAAPLAAMLIVWLVLVIRELWRDGAFSPDRDF